ncbi:histidine phosphatase family protein [Aedoeadaptatus urinae]|uniref:histidine phosphatase family protein n=1 Tax=Aedoeadaptatus urinae TaxID=1871017 RepID=UPI00097CE685|nr:histidine phosphatase family protein [Peptoniphilus urinae]
MSIYMMRHGKTLANEKKCYATPTEPLLPVEEEIVLKLREEVRALHVKAVACSPYLRAKETAAIVAEDLPVTEEPLIREVSLGVLEGRSFNDAYDAFGDALKPWIDDPFAFPPPEGESLREAYKRAEMFLRTAEEDTLYVSHDGFMRLVLAAQKGDVRHFFDYRIDNFQIIKIK